MTSPENYARPNSQHHDPRSHNDDPLLDSLLILCSLHGKPASRSTLSSGLPLENDRLTLNIFPRAAARAGLKARVVTRTPIKFRQCLCLLSCYWNAGEPGCCWHGTMTAAPALRPAKAKVGKLALMPPRLSKLCGQSHFAHPRHEFDLQAEAFLPRTKSLV